MPVEQALRRGRTCQLLAEGSSVDGSAAFLTGLLHGLAPALGTSPADLLRQVPVAAPVRQALLDDDGPLAPVLRTVLAYEAGSSAQAGLVRPGDVRSAYLSALACTSRALGVVGAAYTNNDLDTNTATTLYDLDTALDQVVTQVPANAGTLSPTGKLGVDAGSSAGFDVYSDVRAGSTVANSGFATLGVAGKQRLYRVSLLTGDVVAQGRFPKYRQVADLAVRLDSGR